MAYTTLAELTERFGERMLVQLTDRAVPPTNAINAGVVAREIGNAGAVIDGYLAGRYTLPLAETPPLVADWAQVIAIYKLHPFDVPTKIRDDYTDVLSQLGKVASGAVRLPIAGIEPASSGASGVVAIDRERDFTPENLRGFI